MTKNQGPRPNDQRSDVKNPNNPAYRAAQDNRANQLNPNHAATKGNSDKPQRNPVSEGNGGK